MNDECSITLDNVGLAYTLHYDRTNTLKERVVNLFKRRKYVDEKTGVVNALNGVSLKINNGDRLGVVGLNGAGKSTFLKVLARLLVPTTGSIEILGTVQPLIELGAGFNMEFTGRENIYLNGAMLGFSKKEMQAKEAEIVEFTALNKFIDVPVKYYSSGMVVRLAFTIATTVRPEIVLLDEMLSAGDIKFIDKAKERINRLLDNSKILVMVSHNLSLIETMTKRVIVLEEGKIVFDGPSAEAVAFYRERSGLASDSN
jgi:ABC-type polysaccharide/polyol phosphate transport system ATPase subunit